MLSSVELPIANLNLSDMFDFDFVIASTCLDYETYKFYFMNNNNRFTILDNGAFEKGEAVLDHIYLELAHELKPNVLVLPDVAFDAPYTLARYNRFMQVWKSNPVTDCELMGVIQANGNMDVAHMMGDMYYSNGIKWIGVPYISMIDRYSFIKCHPEYENIHILGLPSLPEALSLGTFPNVKSCDSSLPVKCTKNGKHLGIDLSAGSEGVSPTDCTLDIELLENNLNMFTAVCNGNTRITRL